MIDQAQLNTWAPDVDENNPSQLTYTDQVFPITRGIRSLSLPVNRAESPYIEVKAKATGSNPNTYYIYYPPPTQAYTAYWSDGTSKVYALTERVEETYFDTYDLDGTGSSNTAVNGAVFVLEGNKFTAKAWKKTYATSVVPNDDVPNPWTVTFAMDKKTYGSFAQYGDVCFLATGNAIVYFKAATSTVPSSALSASSLDPKARYVAQAGDFLFLSCSESGLANDSADVIYDGTYWICSAIGVLTSTGSLDLNLTNSDANRCESGRVADTPGPIVGMKALDRVVIIYKEFAVHMLSDDGTSIVQQTLSAEVGALCDNAVVDLGGKHVFMGHNDFYFIEGQSVQSLPNPCKEFLLGPDGDLDKPNYFGVIGHHNKEQTCVYWFYPSKDYAQYQFKPTDFKPVCTKWVCWNYVTNTWTKGELLQVNSTRKVGISCVLKPDLDSSGALSYLAFGVESSNALTSDDPVTWGSNFDGKWVSNAITGTTNRNAAFFSVLCTNSDNTYRKPLHQLAGDYYTADSGDRLKGEYVSRFPVGEVTDATSVEFLQNNLYSDPDTATDGIICTIRTGDFGDGVNLKFVRGIRPRFVGNVTPTSVSCTVYTRENLSEDWEQSSTSYAGTAELNSSSPYWFSIRSNSRYHQFEFIFTGSAELSGYDIDYDDSGTR